MTRPIGASLVGSEEISASHKQSFTRYERSQHLLTTHPDIVIGGATASLRAYLVAMHIVGGR